MQRYFFLNHPYSKKKSVKKNGKKTEELEWVRNIEQRERILKQKGVDRDPDKAYEEFYKLGEKNENIKKLRDIPIPEQYKWIWYHFLNIWQGCEWNMSGSIIFTFRTLNDYVECMKVPLTVWDKKRLMLMKAWACNAISELSE